jgi:hypothetical protein
LKPARPSVSRSRHSSESTKTCGSRRDRNVKLDFEHCLHEVAEFSKVIFADLAPSLPMNQVAPTAEMLSHEVTPSALIASVRRGSRWRIGRRSVVSCIATTSDGNESVYRAGA